jgi:hypothetical protein
VAASSGIQELRSPIRAPKANAICERIIGSLKRECRQAILNTHFQYYREPKISLANIINSIIEMACRSYAYLSSLSSSPAGQAIRHVLQSGPPPPGNSATDSRALCTSSSHFCKLLSNKNLFKTSSRWAPPPLQLYSEIELNPAIVIGYKKRNPPAQG